MSDLKAYNRCRGDVTVSSPMMCCAIRSVINKSNKSK